jgi:hypothetical protein
MHPKVIRTILAERNPKMRPIALVLAAFVVSGPAAAQNWQEYSYPNYAFTVAFPADPQIETTTYQVADGRSVEAHVYSVRLDNGLLKVTVAELANTGLEESAVIDHAIKTLSAGGEVKINIPHRIYRVYGRQLSSWGRTAAARRSRCLITRGGSTRSRAKCFPAGMPSTSSASSNRRYSPTAARTAPRMLSAPYAKLVAAQPRPVSPTRQARTTHAARDNEVPASHR